MKYLLEIFLSIFMVQGEVFRGSSDNMIKNGETAIFEEDHILFRNQESVIAWNEANEVSSLSRPYFKNYAKFARWMVTTGAWGVLATSGDAFSKYFANEKFEGPFANVVSFAELDGTPYFYLTDLDPTGEDIKVNSQVSFSIAEASFYHGCKLVSAEEPTCAKITLSGSIKEVKDPKESSKAITALYKKHPTMALWPNNHEFKIFKLDLQNIFLINFYGGAPKLSVKEYYNE